MGKGLKIASFAEACDVLGVRRDSELVGMVGEGWFQLWDENGELRELGVFRNLITDVGDAFYAKRGANISTVPDTVTGMRLGTGATAASKSGAGAAIVTYVSASHKAIDGSWPQGSQTPGAGYEAQWQTTWDAGEATATGIQEVVITNETPLTNVAGSASNTISRAILSPTVNKGALDTLMVTWNHTLLGE